MGKTWFEDDGMIRIKKYATDNFIAVK